MKVSAKQPRVAIHSPVTPPRFIISAVLRTMLAYGLLFMSVPVSGLSQPQDLIVESITVQGNQRIESPAILGQVTLKKGDRLTTQMTQEQIRLIYDMGFFDDVQVQTEMQPQGVGVIFVVQEKTLCDGYCF